MQILATMVLSTAGLTVVTGLFSALIWAAVKDGEGDRDAIA